MAKRTPAQRWQDYLEGQYALLAASRSLEGLRQKASALKREPPSQLECVVGEAGVKATVIKPSAAEMAFADECEHVAGAFGLAPATVAHAAYSGGEKLDAATLVAQYPIPFAVLVVPTTNSVFFEWVAYEAQHVGLQVTPDGVPGTPIRLPPPQPPDEPLTDAARPPIHSAFRLVASTPPLYPPEEAARLHRTSQQAMRELLRRLGYRAPRRLRSSKLTQQASALRAGEPHLSAGEIYDISDEIFGESDDMANDQSLRNRAKSGRSRVRKRLKKAEGEP